MYITDALIEAKNNVDFTKKYKGDFSYCMMKKVCFSSTDIPVTMAYQWYGRFIGNVLSMTYFVTQQLPLFMIDIKFIN